MSSIIFKAPVTGLLAGLALPPLITKLLLQPAIIQSKYDEIDSLKHEVDFAGWKVRTMEEGYGLQEAEVYVPSSYHEGHQ